MDSDEDIDIDACLDEELRIMEELQEEVAVSQSFSSKRLRSPDISPIRTKRPRQASESDGPLQIVENIIETRNEVDLLTLALRKPNPDRRKNAIKVGLSKPAADVDLLDKENDHEDAPLEEDRVPTEAPPTETIAVESAFITSQRELDRYGNVLPRIPLAGNYLSITGDCGRRVYVTMDTTRDSGGYYGQLPVETSNKGSRPGGLMGTDFYAMLDAAQEELRRQREVVALGDGQIGSSNQADVVQEVTPGGLWVDKYAPKTYTDLLSEESINRTLLRWLKMWDPLVFDRPSPAPLPNPSNSRSGAPAWIPPSLVAEIEATRQDAGDGRPHYKVVLLSGPPGLGKTTLAQILAKHAGYQVLEMNASDDRSPEAFRVRLDAAARSRGAVSSSGRLLPVCLIVDEIDGAPAPAIEVLVSAAKAPISRPSSGGAAVRKKAASVQPLLRPIICICNNLYAPSLRNLRSLALIIRFPDPELSRLSSRLAQIVRLEGMRADMTLLSGLADKADRDIRSCLNTLQFMRGRGISELRRKELAEAGWGQKDLHKSLFNVWQEIFSIPKPREIRRSTATGAGSGIMKPPVEGSMASRFQHIYDVVRSTGDTDKVVQGIFENYLTVKCKDATMQSIVSATDWLIFYDHLNRSISSDQNFTLLRYSSYLPVVFHLTFATSSTVPKLQWPRVENDVLTKLKHSHAVLDSLQTNAWRGVGRTCLVVEVLPSLRQIVHPPGLKPMNTQLYSAREKAQLANTVDILLDAGLDFRQERTPEGQYVYCLDPDLDTLVCFPGPSQHSSMQQLSYAAKQLVSREVALERMRRAERALVRESPTTAVPSEARGQVDRGTADKKGQQGAKAVTVADQIRMVTKIVEPSKMSRDFFGRPIIEKVPEKVVLPTKDSSEKPEELSGQDALNKKIWFRFKEGYSNAIRRPVKIRDLY